MTSQTLTNWLVNIGILKHSAIKHNPERSELISQALLGNEGVLTNEGALGVNTSPYTGRSPGDKFIVNYKNRSDLWWGDINQPISPKSFSRLQNQIIAYLNAQTLYVIDCFLGADPDYRLSVRCITEFAWQALAVQNMFIYNGSKLETDPDITILAAPNYQTDNEIDSMQSKVGVCIDLENKIILIAGTKYAGEIKKSAFTVMNAVLPRLGVLPMHCSVNVGENSDVALYFGLSGTGKTTLSSTSDRKLVGDDEHGWGEHGVFNFEGGCYAKTIRLKPDLEPVIWQAVNQTGTVLENVYISPENQKADFDDARITENTRASYPLAFVENIIPEGVAGHPNNIFLLTADAFGVIPPIAKLNREQAIYYFLSGYTSKVAGTERGLGQKPQATFSTCFGEPFLPLIPNIYADLLRQKIDQHRTLIWLVNTGWTGGDFTTGYRMPLPHTRRMINWILSREHLQASYHTDPIFEIAVPNEIEGIPSDLLYPAKTWQNQAAFNKVARNLKQDFDNNFEKFLPYLISSNNLSRQTN